MTKYKLVPVEPTREMWSAAEIVAEAQAALAAYHKQGGDA